MIRDLQINPQRTHFAVASDHSIASLELLSLKRQVWHPDPQGYDQVCQLGSSNVIASVTSSPSGDQVRVWNDALQEYSRKFSVPGVKRILCNQNCLAVVTAEEVTLYGPNETTPFYNIATWPNPEGAADLCLVTRGEPNSNFRVVNVLVVCPSDREGEICLCNLRESSRATFRAHEHALTCLKLSDDGEWVASASHLGTLIRIFDKTGNKVAEFRRGALQTQITSLAFDSERRFLLAASLEGHIHVFSLGEHPNVVSSLRPVSYLLPSYFSSVWSFRQYRVPLKVGESCRQVCFTPDKSHVIAFTENTVQYRFPFMRDGALLDDNHPDLVMSQHEFHV